MSSSREDQDQARIQVALEKPAAAANVAATISKTNPLTSTSMASSGSHSAHSTLQNTTAAPLSRWQRIRPVLPGLLQAFLFYTLTGMNDASLGILLPSIRAYYQLSEYYTVSLLFIFTTVGFFLAAFTNGYLIERISQARTAFVGCISLLVGYLVVLFAVPFPAMCCMMVFIGYGVALLEAAGNVICGEMPHATVVLNFLHALYGLGALIMPLIASAFLEQQKRWTTTYVVLCGVAALATITTPFGLRHVLTNSEKEAQEQKENEAHVGQDEEVPSDSSEDERSRAKVDDSRLLRTSLKYRITHVGAVFLLLYVGTEVTLGSWGYTFLITARSTDTAGMARIMSGYWGGICAGRVLLGYLTLRFGEKRMIYLYLTVITGMLLLLWFVPYVGVNAMAIALIGVALGPLYPSTVALARKVVSPRLYPTTVGFLSAFGSGGSALFPFINGALIGAKGVQAMLPFCIAMSAAMLVSWIFVPNPARKSKKGTDTEEIEMDTQEASTGYASSRM
ncbi:major facilitator superfamily domain-containing protein [Syncephalastrum racemosum]|uniref:Major facilitator superfamily domain-containing protein n=1 Tax=Syncephalastrum racemosum TaxID=13706 RepID=A0A1X2H5U9_SYNRA|nr:major facilitator superfamily domain-containing protein [Syncephalastrum racemosum]